MKSHQTPKSGPATEIILVVRGPEPINELERFAAAYVRFDTLMTAQLQELEFRFREYLTPQAKKATFLRAKSK
ncbi:MAG: hypothetical protein ACR2FY_00835 [Pirellulaceae bacterium]